jgi:hypothetical protein
MTQLIKKIDIKVGDEISYGFNGDWYPDGVVERITKSGKYLYSSKGTKYVKFTFTKRVQLDDDFNYGDVEAEGYQIVGGTWSLAKGVHNKQNPHF